jgi:hypothetical protein
LAITVLIWSIDFPVCDISGLGPICHLRGISRLCYSIPKPKATPTQSLNFVLKLHEILSWVSTVKFWEVLPVNLNALIALRVPLIEHEIQLAS